MRHVRILGLCLAAVFALTATTLVIASPALATKCDEECQAQKKYEKELKQYEKERAAANKKEESCIPGKNISGVSDDA